MKALKTWRNCGVMITIALLASAGHTHTEAETNAVASSMLEFVLLSVKADLDDVDPRLDQPLENAEHGAVAEFPIVDIPSVPQGTIKQFYLFHLFLVTLPLFTS